MKTTKTEILARLILIIIGIWVLCNLDFILLMIWGVIMVLTLGFIILSPMIILYAIVDSIF